MLEGEGVGLGGESEIGLQAPRAMGCRADVLSRIVVGQSPREVIGVSDITDPCCGFTLNEVNVVHGPASPRLRRASFAVQLQLAIENQ